MNLGIVGAGAMGGAIGRRLSEQGARVLTPLAGRSAATRERAAAAGLHDAAWREIAACDMILSIVPPGQALPVAEAVRDAAAAAGATPLFADCNAIHPDQARRIGAVLEDAGCRFVDAGILGAPPGADGSRAPLVYASGPHAHALATLEAYGLPVRVLAAPVGSASALKMALAAVSKGMTGLLALAMLLAEREAVTDALADQLRRSQPGLSAWGAAQFPQLAGKAPRWVEEMDILVELAANLPGGGAFYHGLSELFAAVGGTLTREQTERWTRALRP